MTLKDKLLKVQEQIKLYNEKKIYSNSSEYYSNMYILVTFLTGKTATIYCLSGDTMKQLKKKFKIKKGYPLTNKDYFFLESKWKIIVLYMIIIYIENQK